MTVADERRIDTAKARRLARHYLTQSPEDGARLERTVSLAARATNFPIGQINIIDDRYLYTIADYGSGARQIPREESLCQFLVDDGTQVLAVDDLRLDERYRTLPAVRSGRALSYLGVPLRSRESDTVGTLCVVSGEARHITDVEIERIQEFGVIVEDQLDLLRRNAETPASRDMSARLARALVTGEIEPWYQPVVELRGGVRVGHEALARWRRPDGSVVNPEAFVGAAEDSDLVIDLDRAVIRAALKDVVRWTRLGGIPRVGVNLSTRHLELPDGVSFMIDAAQEAGIDPSLVNIEITETRGLTNLASATQAVSALQDAGFRVVLDDFANGWSGLDWLIGLGADGIKIDRAVTTALGTPVGDAVARALIGMTTELGMRTIIEGIDSPAHLAAARGHGFTLAQGYLWSPPVPAEEVEAAL